MRQTTVPMLALAAFAGVAGAQDITSVNSLVQDLRVFNDFGASTLVVNTTGTSGVITEGPFGNPTGGSFANKHRLFLSNNGTSAFGLNGQQPFTLEVDYVVDTTFAGSRANRKEGAIEIRVPLVNEAGVAFTDEGRFLVASQLDGGFDEIAVFGGTMPFTGFGSVYQDGSTVRLKMIYTPGDGVPLTGPQATLQVGYSLDGGVTWTMGRVGTWGSTLNDGFTNGTQIAFVAQNSPIGAPTPTSGSPLDQVVVHSWTNVAIIPAPGALALLGLAGLAVGRRRR